MSPMRLKCVPIASLLRPMRLPCLSNASLMRVLCVPNVFRVRPQSVPNLSMMVPNASLKRPKCVTYSFQYFPKAYQLGPQGIPNAYLMRPQCVSNASSLRLQNAKKHLRNNNYNNKKWNVKARKAENYGRPDRQKRHLFEDCQSCFVKFINFIKISQFRMTTRKLLIFGSLTC